MVPPRRHKEMTKSSYKVPGPSWPLEYCWPSLGSPIFIQCNWETSYQLPVCWPLSYHPPVFLPQTWPWFPPNRTAGKELELCAPSAFLYFLPFHRPGDIANPTLLPSHSLFPQLGQGTEPTASLSWLQNPRKTYSPGPQRPRPSLRAGS